MFKIPKKVNTSIILFQKKEGKYNASIFKIFYNVYNRCNYYSLYTNINI